MIPSPQRTATYRTLLKSLVIPGFLAVAIVSALAIYNSVRAAPTMLAPNDVVIVSANSDTGFVAGTACTTNPQSNGFDLLLRRAIGSGTVIKVTDNAWTGTALANTEGYATYTAPTDLAAGSIIRYTDCATLTAGSGWVRTASFDAGTTGENLLVYQGTESAPSFLYGFAFRSSVWITSGSTTAQTSYIPAALASASPAAYATMNVAARNYQYTTAGNYGIYSATFLTDLRTPANWVNSGTNASAGTMYPQTTVPFDATRPTISGVARQTPTQSVTNATSVTFRVTTSESVQGLSSSSFAPVATGTIGYGSVSVATVSGTQYDVTLSSLTGDGTISLGTYTGTLLDVRGNPATDTSFTSPVYTRDATAPMVTVSSLATSQSQPALSGTVNDSTATVTVRVQGVDYSATVSGGVWTLASGMISPALADGIYDVRVTATDLAGNSNIDTTTNELTIDTTAPGVTISRASTQPNPTNTNTAVYTITFSEPIQAAGFTPGDIVLSGTATGAVTSLTQLDATTWTATVSGMVSGQTVYAAIPAGVVADGVGNLNTASVNVQNNVLYDATQPQVFAVNIDVNTAGASMEQPVITFAATDAESGIDRYEVSVDGSPFTVQASGYQPTLLAASSHTVVVRAYDRAGNVREQSVTYPPTISIIAPTTARNTDINDTTIVVGGPVGMNIDAVNITGATGFDCGVLPRSVPFTCSGGVITESGIVTATAHTDTGVSVTNTQAYVIDRVAPVVTVDPITTSNGSPALTGTVDDPTAVVSVRVNGVSYTALNDGMGRWRLQEGVISPTLGAGSYDISISAIDALGNSGVDTTTNELTIQSIQAPSGNGSTVTPAVVSDLRAPNTGTRELPTALLITLFIGACALLLAGILVRSLLARS